MTTHPLPAEAVEAAAIGLFERLYVHDGERHADYDAHWLQHGDVYRKEASAALLAAYPAIREAVVGDVAGMISSLATIVRLHEGNRDPAINALLAKAAAITEQENRNGTER